MQAIFLDIETTGLDPVRHKAIDLAFKIVNLDTGIPQLTYQNIIKQPVDVWDKRDPLSMEINGYTWEMVLTGKPPEQVREEIIDSFHVHGIERGKSFFVCQNPAFDRGFFTHLVEVYTQERLNWPYHWLDLASMYWATRVQNAKEGKAALPDKISLSKNDIAKEYNIPPESSPHRALNGVEHLIQCYQAVLGVQFC